MTTLYRYSFDKRLVIFWGVFGVRPAKDGVTLTDDGRLRATFGVLTVETPLENVDGAHITRNYRWWTAAGARGSMKDDGSRSERTPTPACASIFAPRCRRRSDARATPLSR
jgi:hypothetical protein